MSPLPVLAADPGLCGGAVLLDPDGRTVLDWWAWAWLDGQGGRFRVRASARVAQVAPSMHEVGERLSCVGPCVVVVEGLFLANRNTKAAKGKRRSLLPLAELAGELVGPLRAVAEGPVLRPVAQTQWRPEVLGLGRDASAKDAEEYAVAWAQRHLDWSRTTGLRQARLTLAEEGAVCEAACMAVWGWRQSRREAA